MHVGIHGTLVAEKRMPRRHCLIKTDVDAACDRAGIIERAQICLHAFKQRHTLWLCAFRDLIAQ